MRFEIKRKDADNSELKAVGVSSEGSAVTEEELQELQHNGDFVADLVHTAAESVVDGEETAPIHKHRAYQKWSLSIDTVALGLEDTIDAASPAAQNVSLDTNPYIVRATGIFEAVMEEDENKETPAPEGVKSMFSLDNVDDVAPLGPTNIVATADVAGAIDANEDGSYTVGGIVANTVPSPIAMFTVEPTAAPDSYAGGSIRLVRTDPDGTPAPPIDSEPGVLEAPTVDVGPLENGTYMFHALVIDKFGNVQADNSETDGSRVTVHVLNFQVSDITDLAVTAVDGVDVAEPPAEPVPLRDAVTVGFVVANGSLAAEELSGALHGNPVSSESAEDPENTFSLSVMEFSAMPDGVYTPDGVVTKRNGSVTFPLTTINLDNTGPMVKIETPIEDHTVDSLPTVHATYDDARSGVDGASGSVGLVRIQPPDEVYSGR